MELADSVIDRMKKPKEEQIPLEQGQYIQVNRAEMFHLTTRELAAVISKNPNHPSATAYKKAVATNAPDDMLTIEKIDLEALLENKEVITVEEVGETDVEGVKMVARYKVKKLGGVIKSPSTPEAPRPKKPIGGPP